MNDQIKKPILVVGAGGHARACIDVIELEGTYSISGLVALPHETDSEIMGLPIIGTDSDLPKLSSQCPHALIGVGQIKAAEIRVRLYQQLTQVGFELPSIVSPLGYVSRHATLGAGTLVMHGAIVNAGSMIGNNCIVNNQALVEHDVKVGNHCHISTGAVVNSGVVVGDQTFIGSNAAIRQETVIGKGCVIGMGQAVLSNCPANSTLPEKNNKR